MKSTQEKNSLKNYVVNQSCQGITLLALVVTIVILLILASITISLLLTDTGIFDITNQAK